MLYAWFFPLPVSNCSELDFGSNKFFCGVQLSFGVDKIKVRVQIGYNSNHRENFTPNPIFIFVHNGYFSEYFKRLTLVLWNRITSWKVLEIHHQWEWVNYHLHNILSYCASSSELFEYEWCLFPRLFMISPLSTRSRVYSIFIVG